MTINKYEACYVITRIPKGEGLKGRLSFPSDSGEGFEYYRTSFGNPDEIRRDLEEEGYKAELYHPTHFIPQQVVLYTTPPLKDETIQVFNLANCQLKRIDEEEANGIYSEHEKASIEDIGDSTDELMTGPISHIKTGVRHPL